MRLAAGGAVLLCAVGVQAQTRSSPARPLASVPPSTGLIDESPPVRDLLQKAEEAIAREDWKLAVDSLQRLIDEPGGALIARKERIRGGAQLYESVRDVALQAVAGLPPEGLQAYRLLLDGKAKGLLERAKSEHDTAGLRQVVRRYLLTRWGDDAADALASWALDEGRPVEAARVLRGVLAWCHDRDVPESRLVGKLVAAYAMMGLDTDAVAEINNHQARLGGTNQFEEWLAKVPAAAQAFRSGVPRGAGAIGVGRSDGVVPGAWPFRPSIERGALWSGEIEGGAGAWSPEADVPGHAARNLTYPGGGMASTGEVLIVRTPQGCAGMRLADLQPLWVQPRHSAQALRTLRWDGIQQRFSYDVPFPRSTVVQDYIAGSVSVSGDLALTIERHRLGLDDPDLTPQMRGFNIGRPGREEPLSRLFAYDSSDGSVRWVRGRGGAADDPLTFADFRAIPIRVNGELWVPYYRQNDLYMGVLNPSDGSLLREQLLCSVAGAWDVPGHELRPTHADGIVFAPTGHGLLLAIDATEFSLLWGTGYHNLLRGGDRGATGSESGMISSPPVVAGGAVILGTWDASQLLAFDVMSGQVRWTAAPEGAAYVLDSDEERVWIGGSRIRCLRARDGQELWRYDVPEASIAGRAVACQDVIVVPTSQGLHFLSRESGALLDEQRLPAGELPPGQLLCRGDGLYSLDEEGVRLFPEVEGMEERLRRQFEEDLRPEDALQIARLELYLNRPGAALKVLDRAAKSRDISGSAVTESFSRVRVQAALALAADSGTTAERGLEVLREAWEQARHLDDRMNVGLALGERLDANGHAAEAALLLWELGVGPEGIGLVEQNPGILSQGWLLVAGRFAEIASHLSESERSAFVERVARQVETWSGNVRVENWTGRVDRLLLAVAEMGVAGESSDRARLALAEAAARRLRFEAAEYHLRTCERECRTAEGRLAARMLLVDLYMHPSLPLPRMVERALRGIEEGAASLPVPRTFLGGAEERIDVGLGTVGEWLASIREKSFGSTGGSLEAATGARTGALLAAEGRHAWVQYPLPNGVAPRVLRFPEDSSGLEDRVVLVLGPDQVQCKDAISGRDLWRATLSAPQSFPQVEGPSPMRAPVQVPPPAIGAREGQTGIVTVAESGVFAIGLASGKQLWHRAFSRIPQTFAGERPVNPVAVRGDALIALSPRHLALVRVVDGSSRWEVRLTDVAAGELWLTEDRAIVADVERQGVVFLDRVTGRRVATARFRQPDAEGELVRLVRSGDLLIGPVGDQGGGLQAVNIQTGETAWTLELSQKVVQIFEAAPGYIGVGVLGTEFQLVDAKEGELLRTLSVPGGRAVRDGTLVDGTLVLQQVVTRNNLRYPRLQVVDLVTGEDLWSRESLAPSSWAELNFVIAGRGVFTVLEDQSIDPPQRQRVSPARKLMVVGLDLASGQPIGTSIEIPHADNTTRMTGDFVALPGALVVGTDAGVYGFRTVEAPGSFTVSDEGSWESK